jgi:hypothetical protein
LLGAQPRSYQVTPNIQTGGERHNKAKPSPRADSMETSQPAAGPDPLRGAGRHQPHQESQQAWKAEALEILDSVGFAQRYCALASETFRRVPK